MSSLNAYIRTAVTTKPAKIHFRYRNGTQIDIDYLSDIYVNPLTWDSKKQQVKKSTKFPNEDIEGINRFIAQRKVLVLEVISSLNQSNQLTTKFLQHEIECRLYPKTKSISTNNIKVKKDTKVSFFDIFDRFLEIQELSDGRKAQYQVVKRTLERFEFYIRLTEKKFNLSFDTFTFEMIHEYEKFLRDEYEYAKDNIAFINQFTYYKSYRPRGINTVSGILKKVKAFNNWAIKFEFTTNYLFKKFKFKEIIYGTPIFLTLVELKKIYYHNFKFKEKYETQRDIFIFQSLTGLRVGDMYKLTRANVINGFLHYIPEKTKRENAKTVVVPLNSIALNIVKKYEGYTGYNIFPFLSFQKYNYTIKDVLTLVGITRNVTTINPLTRDYELKPMALF